MASEQAHEWYTIHSKAAPENTVSEPPYATALYKGVSHDGHEISFEAFTTLADFGSTVRVTIEWDSDPGRAQ